MPNGLDVATPCCCDHNSKNLISIAVGRPIDYHLSQIMSHHVLKKSLQTFGNDIQAFGSEISNEIDVLKKRVSLEKSITGASTYKNCIEDLKERVEETASLIKDISGVSNASVSTQVRCFFFNHVGILLLYV